MNGRAWMGLVAALPCVLCTHCGVDQQGRTTVHHIREGQGMSQRASDALVAALCGACHQGPNGLHGLGTRGFYARYKLDELDLLAMTIETIYKSL